MPGFTDWQPHKTHVQGGLREGNFVNAQFIMISAGPPHLQDIGAYVAGAGAGVGTVKDVVYPIGLTQNLGISQNKAVSKIFEIGSDRSYVITGRTFGQLSFSRIWYHGPNLLRCLYAYYGTGVELGTYPIDSLFESEGKLESLNFPFTSDTQGATDENTKESQVKIKSGLHGVRIPPGFDNMFLNLASDLFSQPIGLLLSIMDNEENPIASAYFEQCYVPSHSIGFDSNGLIVQESIGIQYERIVPIDNVQVKLVDKILADPQGARAF